MDFFNLITSIEAHKIIQKKIGIYKAKENIDVTESLNRVLAEDVMAPEDLPAFTKSIMDGYALQGQDTFGVSEEKPQSLELIGKVEMGKEPTVTIESGQAANISTGGMMPSGANAVIMVEDTELKDNRVKIYSSVSPGENIIYKGSDIEAGQRVLPKNHQLRSQDIGALAGLGIKQVEVYKKLKVGIISTGDELIRLDEKLKLGQTRDINTYSLSSLIEQIGAVPVTTRIIKDDYQSLKAAIEKLRNEVDFILISGGSSVGTRDVTYEVLDELGSNGVLIHGVAVKPGKPTIFTMLEDTPIYGLPGHPVSVMVIFKKFVAPYIEEGLGIIDDKIKVKAKFNQNLSSAPGREDYLRVKLKEKDGNLLAIPVRGGSSLIMTMVEADGLVKIPLSREGLSVGEVVEVELFK
ncbi:molybdopterin molybdotransferase MoeA [Selenihalanaerobacter shriftii]|uniref:Molybdopterin molybdenumtransferase n=1 Tax=Selenihalanaerobacter shriftii TaxID=142842 RepID=A0A1T4JVJ9_9FIRM|nr:gephyrin-like molybdotransferase Glp [Selenihalanaerobacter shriftii]SJZ34164.1 molybdopterin molybdochelatase [Selenihalanaerobacter shriftii]